MSDSVFIYALCEPETGEMRYIGKSANPKVRLRKHLTRALNERNHRANWIRSVQACGLIPALEIIDEASYEEWPALEAAYIEYFRECGCDLTNATLGGEDPPSCAGKKQSPGHIAKRVAHVRGVPKSAACRLKLSLALSGEKHPCFGKPGTMRGRFGNKSSNFGRKMPSNTSGFVGVYWHKRAKKYIAQCSVAGRPKQIGYFSKLEDAVFARALAIDNLYDGSK